MLEKIAAALDGVLEETISDEELQQIIAGQMSIDLTPYTDDGSTEADTYLLSVYLGNSERWLPSVRLLDLIHDQFDATLASESTACEGYDRGREGYDRALEGFVAELAECLAIAERALKVERIKGIRDGNWGGSVEDA